MSGNPPQHQEPSCQEQAEALLLAFAERDLSAIGDLLDAGYDLDGPGAGLTILMRAVLRGDGVAMEWMLAAGADPEVVSSDGKTALDLARELDRPELAELLILAGAGVVGAPAASPVTAEASTAAARIEAFRAEDQHPVFDDRFDDRFEDWIDDGFEDRFAVGLDLGGLNRELR